MLQLAYSSKSSSISNPVSGPIKKSEDDLSGRIVEEEEEVLRETICPKLGLVCCRYQNWTSHMNSESLISYFGRGGDNLMLTSS